MRVCRQGIPGKQRGKVLQPLYWQLGSILSIPVEADFALVDILAFYSHNKAQIARIFRASALGQRDKAKRNDYVNYMLNKCFDRILPPGGF